MAVENEVKLSEIGTHSENCEIIDLEAGDLVKTVDVYYTTEVDQLIFTTENGLSTTIGTRPSGVSVKEYRFD